MRRFISMLFMLALVAAVVYNAWQVTLLRRDIASLRKEVSTLKAGRNSGSGNGVLDLDYKQAVAKIEKSLQAIQRMYQDADNESRDVKGKARDMLNNARSSVDQLRKKLDKESPKDKGG